MKKTISFVLIVAMVLALFTACVSKNPSETTGETKPSSSPTNPAIDYANSTVILYTGNIRGNVEIYSQVAAAKAHYEAMGATVYLVDAGNYLQGTAYANSDRGLTIYNLMDAAGYDVAAMGPFEFVYGDATTGYIYHSNFTKYFTQAELLMGSDELVYQKNAPWAPEAVMDTRPAKAAAGFTVICSNLTAGDEATGYYAFAANTVLGYSLKVGFVSSVDENIAGFLQDGYLKGYTFGDVTAPQCDILVALGGGNGDIVITAPADGETVVGAYVINNTTKAVIKEAVPMTGSSTAVETIIAAEQLSGIVGTSEVILDGSDRSNWNSATNLGALTADALKWYAENKLEGIAYPVVAIQNGGNCDNFIYTGEITEVDLLKALPFSPMGVGVVYMTGAELLETLEAATQRENCPGWAQVAGLAYTVDVTKAYDAGEAYGDFFKAGSINRVTVTSPDFSTEATYAVVCDKFLLKGNDTYYTMVDLELVASAENGVKTRDIVALYIREVLGGTVGSAYAK